VSLSDIFNRFSYLLNCLLCSATVKCIQCRQRRCASRLQPMELARMAIGWADPPPPPWAVIICERWMA